MTTEELIAAIRSLMDYHGVNLSDIEKTLKIPRNSLSGMIGGKRPFSEKWQKLLVLYVEAKLEGKKKIVIPIGKTPKAQEVLRTAPEPAREVFSQVPLPEEEIRTIAEKAYQTLPEGLSKIQQIRWLREHFQTSK